MEFDKIHIPVLLERSIELLEPALDGPNPVVVDATLGMGGHTRALLTKFPHVRVVGLDRDTDALNIARTRLADFGDRVTFVHTIYDGIDEALDELDIDSVQGVLFDLGVSSMQLDRAERGFAYSKDAPLDMRMDRTTGPTAADVVNTASEADLRRIFHEYGEERLAPRYAKAIVAARAAAPIETSAQLVAIITEVTPVVVQRAGHPAKRVFQALRIEVNDELGALERAIPRALDSIDVGGRIVVLSYQSLEDRIVKRALAQASSSSAPVGLPVELPEHAPTFKLLVRGAEFASDDEQEENSRAKPVRLRAAQRMRRAS